MSWFLWLRPLCDYALRHVADSHQESQGNRRAKQKIHEVVNMAGEKGAVKVVIVIGGPQKGEEMLNNHEIGVLD